MKPWAATPERLAPHHHPPQQRDRSMTNATKSSLASGSTDDDPVTAKILKLVNDLVNTVLAKKAASELNAIKARRTPHFSSPLLFRRVIGLLAQHKYHLPVCRFVLDLFDRGVLRHVVLDESDDDDDLGDRDFGELARFTDRLLR